MAQKRTNLKRLDGEAKREMRSLAVQIRQETADALRRYTHEEVGVMLAEKVQRAAQSGAPWAKRAGQASLVETCVMVMEMVEREMRVQFVGYNGQALSVKATIGVRGRDDNGMKQKTWEQAPLFLATWPELEEKRASVLALSAEYAHQRETLDAILTLRGRFPTAKTPLEACEMAGVGWKSLDLSAM